MIEAEIHRNDILIMHRIYYDNTISLEGVCKNLEMLEPVELQKRNYYQKISNLVEDLILDYGYSGENAIAKISAKYNIPTNDIIISLNRHKYTESKSEPIEQPKIKKRQKAQKVDRQDVLTLHKKGLKMSAIAKKLGISNQRVSQILSTFTFEEKRGVDRGAGFVV